jgi:hypothetical protein
MRIFFFILEAGNLPSLSHLFSARLGTSAARGGRGSAPAHLREALIFGLPLLIFELPACGCARRGARVRWCASVSGGA